MLIPLAIIFGARSWSVYMSWRRWSYYRRFVIASIC